ncbi:MAG: iron-containing alcohol dehydrogenase [Negativicutes bacterium]|nr:iron-containing alcohol dehydrogenase [Negativicutes bacterium]
MSSFKLPTEIKIIDSIAEFAKVMKISNQDLLITNAPIYEPYLKGLNLTWRIVFQENYGTGEPSDRMINAIISDLRGFNYDRVFAVGGGTVIDVAKVLALSGIDNVLDALYGRVPLVKKRRLLAIPTTCGTGSEVTNIAILEDTQAHVKKGIVGPAIFPDEAILVPELVQGLPYKFFAFSSIDALIHAVESYLAPASNLVTEMFVVEAMQKIIAAYQEIVRRGPEVQGEVIGQVLIASTFAGIAFGNTGVGAVHAMSYPLGGKYHIAHGESNYAFLDVVLRKYEASKPAGKISMLKRILGNSLGINDADKAIGGLADLLAGIIPLRRLREYGVQESELENFAQAAMDQKRLMKNNYVRLDGKDLVNMYQSRY